MPDAYVIDEMISAKAIAARIEALAQDIKKSFAGTEKLVVVGLLRGSFVFIADLVREPFTLLAAIGFFLPAAVLSAVTPVAAKALLASVEETGTVVGSLSAIGTSGALFGTFVTGFVLVAAMPSQPITWIVGLVLVVCCAVVTPARPCPSP